ncbi:hypothetical protein AaE_012802, partial [Aphanomyces astaci]
MASVSRLTQVAASSDECGDDGMHCATPNIQVPSAEDAEGERNRRRAVVEAVIQAKLRAAEDEGLTVDLLEKLRLLLTKHGGATAGAHQAWRLLCQVWPATIPPAHVELLKTHVREFEAAGLVYRNNRATWASAPRIVPKKDPGDLRTTIDSRPINACTEPMPLGARVFFTLDWFKGYWQLALHEDSQMYYSFMAPFGVYTPTRVLMGQTDVVAFCQSAVDFMFADLLFKGLLAWFDDTLGYAETPEYLLDQVLTSCSSFGLQLNPKKCDFFLTKAVWCGKFVRVRNQLDAVPCFTELVTPLCQLLDAATKKIGSAKKTKLTRVQLTAVGWDVGHLACFDKIKEALLAIVPMAHPRAHMMVCLYTDASEGFWGVIATQVPFEDLPLPLEEQCHQPLAFSAVPYWRKRAMAKRGEGSVCRCEKLQAAGLHSHPPSWLPPFHRPQEPAVHFQSCRPVPNMARYQAHKLERWVLLLSSFPYTIECLPGEDNVWGNLLSRWGAAQAQVPTKSVRRLLAMVSPLQQPDFDWPSPAGIVKTQQVAVKRGGRPYLDPTKCHGPPAAGLHRSTPRRRGPSSNRSHDQGRPRSLRLEHPRSRCQDFCPSLHLVSQCRRLCGPAPAWISAPCREAPRVDPLRLAIHAHGDERVAEDHRHQGRHEWVRTLAQRDKRRRGDRQRPPRLVHDIWNEILDKIRKAAGAHHYFTTAYCPWANGTVEVINRQILRAVKTLTSELKLRATDWHLVLHLVQGGLNHMPSDRLSGMAPVTAFTGLYATTPLSAFVNTVTKEVANIDWLDSTCKKHMDELHEAMEQLHREVAAT